MKYKKHIIFLIIFFLFYINVTYGFSKDLLEKLGSEFKEQKFISSNICGKCHIDIFKYWKSSMHFLSYEDPIFMTAYMQAFFNTNGKAREFCLRCHAPVAYYSKDFEFKNEVSKEGITCDFCHSVSGIDLNNLNNHYKVENSQTKFGPLRNMESPVHITKATNYFRKSEFCAGCHELKGKNGVGIISTYSEWKEGPYSKKGIQCQNCHMPYGPGFIVDQNLKKSVVKMNLHDVTGGHSVELLSKVAKVEIIELKNENETIFAKVRVTNVKSGHMMPTGTPSRELILKVAVNNSNGNTVCQDSKTIKKVLADEQNKELLTDSDIILNANSILSDNRIPPGDSKEFQFLFNCNLKGGFSVDASLVYMYRPQIINYGEMAVDMTKDSKRLGIK